LQENGSFGSNIFQNVLGGKTPKPHPLSKEIAHLASTFSIFCNRELCPQNLRKQDIAPFDF